MPTKKRSVSRTQPSLPNVPPPEMGAVKKSKPKVRAKPAGPGRGGDLFIIDNSNEQWTAARYLHDWCDVARAMDVATGYFEIGSLLALDGQWQKLEQIRILMGDEVSKRTKQAFDQAVGQIASKLDDSIEREKETNDFLTGVPAIVEALQNAKITCRVYRERKFHAKAYITHAKMDVIGSTALVGSSNFTYPGLTENVELNVRIRNDVEELQKWYEHYWDGAEEVTPEILKVIERHTREYSPFDVYMKALFEFFQGHEMTAGEWERSGESKMYPVLDHYQREGYYDLLEKAEKYNGALLCDSVGLGKTFIGLMLIERLLFDRKRVALIVPKSTRGPVWEAKIRRYLPGVSGAFSNLVIYNHTDLLRGREYIRWMEEIQEKADAVIIDEGHHFRNQATSTYKKLFSMLDGKQVFLLTATPINNTTLDLQHLIELFSRRQPDYFRSLGIHTLIGHFRELEAALTKVVGRANVDISTAESEQVLKRDELFRALVVQRSRAYARLSQEQHGGEKVVFPDRFPPNVADYSLAKTYGSLLHDLKKAFNKEKPLLTLAVYYPLNYPVQLTLGGALGREFDFEKGRQEQVVGLIRTQLLKRFESSAWAFRSTCEGLLLKLLAWVEVHSESSPEKRRLERWKAQHEEMLQPVIRRRSGGEPYEEGEEDSALPVELLEDVQKRSRAEYDVDTILNETYLDMEQLIVFLSDLKEFSPAHDDKLQTLVGLLKNNPLLSKHKVLIFSEYRDTARYLEKQLKDAGLTHVEEVDSGTGDRVEAITSFAPYYNESSTAELMARGMTETRVLVSTDVLSEGLNLQDATLMINYDLHWNPVRLMQRIGRVDRRLDASVEEHMVADHPDAKDLRGKVHFWNFLPPGELDELLRLYQRVAHKTLRISKLFGIEGKQLLRPDDDYEALKEFNKAYEGQTSPTEEMRLVYRDLLKAHPGLEEKLASLPKRLFSGREHPSQGAQVVFFCYRLPGPDTNGNWSLETGATEWYLYDLANGKILEEPEEINKIIRSTPETARHCELGQKTLVEARQKVEAHILNDYLRSRQAPAGVKPVLKAWLELN